MKNLTKLTREFIANVDVAKPNFSSRQDAIDYAKRAYGYEAVAAVEILCNRHAFNDDGSCGWSREDLKDLMEWYIGSYMGFDDFATNFLYHREMKFRKLHDNVINFLDDEKVARDTLLADASTSTENGGQYRYIVGDDGILHVFRRPDASEENNWLKNW